MKMITIQEAADRLGVSRATVERMVNRGDIGSYCLPTGTVRLDSHDIDEFIKKIHRPENQIERKQA